MVCDNVACVCVCGRACVAKMVCNQDVCERWCVTRKMVCDNVVYERWCVTKLCVCDKDVCERWCVTELCVTKMACDKIMSV